MAGKKGGRGISPWFMYRRVLNSIQDGGGEQELEIDFQLGQGQAVEIAGSWLGVGEWNVTAIQAAIVTAALAISLHRRTGTLTDEMTPAASSDFTQSEVLQDLLLGFGGLNTAAAGGGFSQIVNGQPYINWRELLGEPLLVAANLTVRMTAPGAITGAITWNGVYAKLLYRYVRVTDADLVRAFIARQ